jgi:hypothetical protein
MYPRIIGLYSPEARCGKGTVAAVLTKHYGYQQRQFSAPIKAAWQGLLSNLGLQDLILDTLEGSLKERPLPELGGLSFRTFGEHVGNGLREAVGPDLWITMAEESFRASMAKGLNLVVSDLRYPNEYALIQKLGGINVKVRRPGHTRGFQHPSEGRLENTHEYRFDHVLIASEVDDLRCQAVAMMEDRKA